jgi:hypothetical protein
MMRLPLKVIIVVALALVVAGCSQAKLFYGFLDNWIRWQVEDLIDLNSAQDELITRASKEFHQWHRTNELPRYAALISDVRDTLAEPVLNQETITEYLDRAQGLWLDSSEQLKPAARKLFQSLSDEQVQTLLQNLDEENREALEEKEARSESERIETLANSRRKTMKRMIGKLDTHQEDLIRQWAHQRNNMDEYFQDQYQQWRVEFGQTLMADRNDEQVLDQLVVLTFVEAENEDPEAVAKLDENRALGMQLFIDLHSSLSDKQKAKLLSRLENYAEDAIELSQKD